MTGYASASSQALKDAESSAVAAGVTVELRSVNGRFLDLTLRLPDDLRSLEPALRELLVQGCRRGKVELRMVTRRGDEAAWPQPQAEQLNRLSWLEGTVRGWLPSAKPLSVHEALQWCRQVATGEALDEPALEAARRAVAAQSTPREALQERALNEAAAFAVRIDVAEELTRLVAHLDEVERLLRAGGEIGKRLEFLIQELQREANTLGAKSAALELTNISVEMKVLIEQLREQVQNIE